MSFDLGAAVGRKGQFESARLDDLEFRVRARTMRRIADRRSNGPAPIIAGVARHLDAAILKDLPGAAAIDIGSRAEARTRRVAELGDPAPRRLA